MIRTMCRGYRASAVLGLTCLALGFHAKAQMDDRGGDYYPVEPAQLLALLPAPPENWKLTLSMAKERLSYALQPETLAMRKFLFIPPPPLPGTPPEPPGPPKEVMMTLLDTGHDPERMRPFDNFKGSDDPKSPHILVQGFATLQLFNDPNVFLSTKISDRFILSVQFSNMKDSEIDLWKKHWLPLKEMADASDAAPNVPMRSGTIILPYVDDLKPSDDFQSKQYFKCKADLRKVRSPF